MTSRKAFVVGLFILYLAPAFGQQKPVAKEATPVVSQNCYGEWLTLFRTRGADPVPDGTHEVVISMRRDETSDCFMGKVEVVGGKIKLPVWIQKQDGSYETFASAGKKLDPAFAATVSEDQLLTITDGMSFSFRTSDQETGRIFFYKFVSAKPKANKIAPSPGELVKY